VVRIWGMIAEGQQLLPLADRNTDMRLGNEINNRAASSPEYDSLS
jgi:hypothetical protein